MVMSVYPATAVFKSASVILPVINETESLRQTVDMILERSRSDVSEFIIVVCKKTTPESLAVVDRIRSELGALVRVHWQSLPFLGGAMREAFDLATASHVIMMASDLETDPACVPKLVATAKAHPDAIVTASRWHGGGFVGYSRVKLVANWVFQKVFSALYGVALSDMTYGYRIFPTRLVQAIRWDELRHPLLFETLVKPLRLGVQVFEMPAVWRARQDGESQNTFLRNFEYFRTGIRCRFAPKHTLLKTWAEQSKAAGANILGHVIDES
jgi:glycosyltransferase involved in cell wall biosynthesis